MKGQRGVRRKRSEEYGAKEEVVRQQRRGRVSRWRIDGSGVGLVVLSSGQERYIVELGLGVYRTMLFF